MTLSTVKESKIDPYITVEELISRVLLKNPNALLRVAGRVKEADLWNCYCYGILESENSERIKFRVSEHDKPEINEFVIIVGSLKTSKKLHLELHGHIERPYIIPKNYIDIPEKRIDIPERQGSPLLLKDFIEKNGLHLLGFLISKTGWNDICTSSGISEITDCPRIITNFSNEKQFIKDGERLLSRNVQGIVIVRGGGEGLGVIGNSHLVTCFLVKNSVRFYTAMGHANDDLMIDKRADEAFCTPSDFGHRLREILNTKQQKQQTRSKRSNLIQIERHLNNDVIPLKEHEIALKESKKKILMLNLFLLIIMTTCLFLIFTIIFN